MKKVKQWINYQGQWHEVGSDGEAENYVNYLIDFLILKGLIKDRTEFEEYVQTRKIAEKLVGDDNE